ncbi:MULTISPECIES: replication-associated recombination protein A [Lachnospira]|jgi:putative ATPase|uniref:Replication-associated recombination protein A n=1 Tax=Lachnospira multipara TaxID=28051 RepID=A0A1H5SDS7_9FIRM|nr:MULTISPECIES: replication-associated recombination protein A [Lachnospira]SEF48001.1 putative ATPase [Lachnospira multipara]
MDLFDYMRENNSKKESPLAMRLRPKTLDDIVGQEHIIGKDSLLYRAIKADKLSSVIFYGPPGTGKTTLAKVIANTTSADFRQINATIAGKKDMEEVVKAAKDNLAMYGKKTILFIDEIHRFNKGQQDFLLPYVEDGTLVLVGATTENPYFEVNAALISRSIIFELMPLKKEDIKVILKRAVYDEVNGMGSYNAEIDEEALDFLADISNGDARSALNAIELGILTTDKSEDGKIHIDLEVAQNCIQKRAVRYDSDGDNHYDTISAFIKSMRGSDPDAVTYYLAKMLYAGEDIKFIARRIMICASEDVGMADPNALNVAVSACLAVERVGMPEARIILAEAAIYIAKAPKSNASYMAIDRALEFVKTHKQVPVPTHLQDAHYKGAAKLGHGVGYKYPHAYPGHYVEQQYLPDEYKEEKFYIEE